MWHLLKKNEKHPSSKQTQRTSYVQQNKIKFSIILSPETININGFFLKNDFQPKTDSKTPQNLPKTVKSMTITTNDPILKRG